jgi:hypothetical protein
MSCDMGVPISCREVNPMPLCMQKNAHGKKEEKKASKSP